MLIVVAVSFFIKLGMCAICDKAEHNNCVYFLLCPYAHTVIGTFFSYLLCVFDFLFHCHCILILWKCNTGDILIVGISKCIEIFHYNTKLY